MSKSWAEEMVYRYQKEIQLLTKERDKLKKELSISNKALELCERHHIGFEDATVKEQVDWRETRIKENIDYFKAKAKEKIL